MKFPFLAAVLAASTLTAPLAAAPPAAPQSASAGAGFVLPGREADARVARIVFRLATAGAAHCPHPEPATGLVLQHLSQFHPADRLGMIAALALDRGPAAIAVVPGGPAANAGIRTQDVLLTAAGAPLPPEPDLALPFDATRAHARDDQVADLLARSGTAPVALGLLRDGHALAVRMTPVAACPARVALARSAQRNAYADTRHVFLTTGLVALARSDDELAFVIAHEMAHVILGHAAVMRSGAVAHGIGQGLGESGRIVRETERQADRLGGELMLDAGYDPVAGADILHRVEGGDLGIELFATHDTAATRIAAMRALAEARRPR